MSASVWHNCVFLFFINVLLLFFITISIICIYFIVSYFMSSLEVEHKFKKSNRGVQKSS